MFTFENLVVKLGQQNVGEWEKLWNALLQAESRTANVAATDVHWDFRSSVGDGGRDITVNRGSRSPDSKLIPNVASTWSVKSGNDGLLPGTLRNEIMAANHPTVQAMLRNGGKYCYCVCRPATADQRDALAQMGRTLEGELGITEDSIVIHHCDHLVEALKRHPGVLRDFFPELASLSGLTLTEWSRQRGPAFDPTIPFVDLQGRAGILGMLVEHLVGNPDHPLLHVAGISGIGKTRLVYEACVKAKFKHRVLYYSDSQSVRPILDHIRKNPEVRCVIVVDECSLTDMEILKGNVHKYGNQVRVVSIGPSRASDESRDGVLVLSQPEEAAVLSLLQSEAKDTVDRSILHRIARESGHDIRFALMLWEVVKKDDALASDPQALIRSFGDPQFVFRRVLGLFTERLGQASEFLDIYKWLTLARDVGHRHPRRNEVQYLAEIAATNIARLDTVISLAKDCGLGESPAHLFEAIPRGMATLIFTKELWPAIDSRFEDIFTNAPSDSFRQGIMHRIEMCSEKLKKEVRSRVDQHFRRSLGEPVIAAFNAATSARLVRAWVEFSPDAGLMWLADAVEAASLEELREFKGVGPDIFLGGSGSRREITWAVVHLACFNDYYRICERILFRLALAENESIGNNATAEWRHRHRIYLSNVQTPYGRRMAILCDRLRAADETTAPLLLSGFIEAISPPNAVSSPPAVIGGRLVPREWRPQTNRDIYDHYVAAIVHFLELATAWGEPLQALARVECIEHFDVFHKEDTIAGLRTFLGGKLTGDQRRALARQIQQALGLHRRSPDTDRGTLIASLEAWLSDLAPADPVEEIKGILERPPWDYDRLVGHTDDDEALENAWKPQYRRAAELAVAEPARLDALETWLNEAGEESQTAFGATLFGVAVTAPLESTLGRWLREKKCLGVCVGFSDESRIRTDHIPAWVTATLNALVTTEPDYAARMSAVMDPSEAGFGRIMLCSHVPGAKLAHVFARLFGYRWGAILTPERQGEVLDRLVNQPNLSDEDVAALVHLMRMYLHGDKTASVPEPLRNAARILVERPPAKGARRADTDWKRLALRLRHTNPDAVQSAAIELAVNWDRFESAANQEAIDVLAVLAAEHRPVLAALLPRIAAAEVWHPVHLESWQSLFAKFSVTELEAMTQKWSIEFARRLGQLVPDPSVDDNQIPIVPRVTEWYLDKFGDDEQCFREFSVGRWNGRVRSGWSWQQTDEVNRKVHSLLKHPLPAIQRWARELAEEHKENAERDRIDYEDMNRRG